MRIEDLCDCKIIEHPKYEMMGSASWRAGGVSPLVFLDSVTGSA